MLYLKRILSFTLLSLSLLSINGHAEQSYQVEVTGGYEKEDADTSTDKFTTLGAEIYFSPVNTKDKPLAEAAFLDKSSSVIIGYIKSKSELQNSSINSIDASGPLFAINYVTKTDAFILGAVYSTQDLEVDPNVLTSDIKTTGIEIGKYLDGSSAIKFTYMNSDTEFRSTVSSLVANLDIDSYKLEYKTVQPLNATSYFLFNAGVELIKKNDSTSVKEDNNELSFFGEYYLTRMTSFGVAASFNSGDDVSDEGITLGIVGTHFLTQQIALEISFSKFNADDSQTEDTDSISVDIIARF